uniref:Uncharacterized protein n=1 Tax=Octopus bimaculoides TaxID=37653 RepID=A0A0L8H760_OCTBM
MSTISCADSGRGLSKGNSENYKDLHGKIYLNRRSFKNIHQSPNKYI